MAEKKIQFLLMIKQKQNLRNSQTKYTKKLQNYYMNLSEDEKN